MATKKFIIEVEEGYTECEDCPMECDGRCPRAKMGILDCCDDYNLATMKITEMEESQCSET